MKGDDRPNSVAIAEVSPRDFRGIATATEAFIEHVDARLSQRWDPDRVLDEWRSLSIHQRGDRITCVLGERTVNGAWAGIDEHGRAMLRDGEGTITVGAGDLILS
jgi:biotin-(acetyl-CoA carboxylase) ligase